jgi:hypothetical protein
MTHEEKGFNGAKKITHKNMTLSLLKKIVI